MPLRPDLVNVINDYKKIKMELGDDTADQDDEDEEEEDEEDERG